jgi:hypothetical protein
MIPKPGEPKKPSIMKMLIWSGILKSKISSKTRDQLIQAIIKARQ